MYVVIIQQDAPSDWKDSWKLGSKDTTDYKTLSVNFSSTETFVTMRINEVFLPGWSNSWLLAAPIVEAEEHYKNWSSCWGYRQQIR